MKRYPNNKRLHTHAFNYVRQRASDKRRRQREQVSESQGHSDSLIAALGNPVGEKKSLCVCVCVQGGER